MVSQVFANDLLNVMFGISDAVSLPNTLYLGVCANEPAAYDGAITGEPTAAGYARKEVGGSLASVKKLFGAASYGKITNNVEIQFATVMEAAGVQNYYFISKSPNGNAIAWGKLSGDIATTGIGEKTVPTFFAGELEFSIDKKEE